jgi:hypothetical protein
MKTEDATVVPYGVVRAAYKVAQGTSGVMKMSSVLMELMFAYVCSFIKLIKLYS